MKKIKRVITLLGFVLLMVLASVGMGISGAAPVMPTHKRENALVIDVEEVGSEETETDVLPLDIHKT